MFSADIIILGFIAGFVLFRLYTVLGRKDDDGSENLSKNNKKFSNVIDISSVVKTVEEKIVQFSAEEIELSKGFEKILDKVRKLDPQFSLKKFLEGGNNAFEMILIAFAENDRQTLKSLLSEDIYKQFCSEIDKRIKNEINLSITLVALPVVEIRDIKLEKNKITIDVFYQTQQINILKDKQGEVIEGDPSQIDIVEDLWSYSKELNGKENWKLIKVNAA